MSERDYAPLSTACVRALHDKLYDKRKTAALEIEKMVREFANVNNTAQIRRLLKVLGQDFAVSQNPHAKKGGLIGLASIAVALGKDSETYIDELITPILACLSDQDLRVRYYACESLYNVVKIARNAILSHFCPIFNALSKIATDPDQNVKSASELLDRLLKDIVIESNNFDLDSFLPLLRERIASRNSFARQFVITWISVLNMVPNMDLISYLPEILDGLFKILDDPILEVKKMCETTLGEFLRSIKSDSSRVNFQEMINILIVHAQEKNDDLVQFTAITWMKEFVQLSGPQMLPYMSGIFTAVLPCLSYDSDARRMTDIKETATAINYTLMKLLSLQADKSKDAELRPDNGTVDDNIDLSSVVKVLTQFIMHNSIQTKVAVLKWIHDLYIKMPDQMANHIDVLFPALQNTLSDQSDEVVQQCLVVIAEVISSPEHDIPTIKEEKIQNKSLPTKSTYYNKFILSLLNSFRMNHIFLSERGSFVIRQLCVLLNAEDIYRTLAHLLKDEMDLKFVRLMVEHLNMILLTSAELFELRTRLKNLEQKENFALFLCLYDTWCYNAVATVSLCFLTQNYSHACHLIKLFGNLEVTVDFLIEIDKLVQLIESPIFAYLRLELLEVPCNQSLIRALYGLLMLLPQTEAFHTLRTRLNCIPSTKLNSDPIEPTEKKISDTPITDIDEEQLLKTFGEAQNKYTEFKKKIRAIEVNSGNREIINLE
ncbi:hypothetical protein WA026_018634 [Henosepilachna vigintioctopunctata]|uniref:Protein VAC14 homolog n=1 Tax=Henosepilachna vigintioctopunctata TaxID=420089 RepID=A0AAW1U199_9CUCU